MKVQSSRLLLFVTDSARALERGVVCTVDRWVIELFGCGTSDSLNLDPDSHHPFNQKPINFNKINAIHQC